MTRVAFLFSAALLPVVYSYSWTFSNSPAQCQNITINISGSGTPPYRVLFVPTGQRPLPNNVEPRRIVEQNFTESATSTTFQLKYPTGSQFVAVVSDATGFGSGGTSGAVTVQNSTDSSCYSSDTSVAPDFSYSINPLNTIVQCSPTRLYWDASAVQGTPRFQGIIPGGQSFSIPATGITTDTVNGLGTGFNWTASIRAGTTLIIAAGDLRGTGSAGSSGFTVQEGLNPDTSCLSDSSPSSTAGYPAGGSYPTTTGSAVSPNTPSSGSKSIVGPVVGGVVGGLVLLAAVLLTLLFLRRRDRLHKTQKEKPVDLLQDGDNDGDDAAAGATHRNDLPQYYQPEPFMVPDPTIASSSNEGRDENGRPLSGATSLHSGTPDAVTSTSASGRKSTAGLRPLRPVNIIQHDDAGPSQQPVKEEDSETIELPPAYTNIRA